MSTPTDPPANESEPEFEPGLAWDGETDPTLAPSQRPVSRAAQARAAKADARAAAQADIPGPAAPAAPADAVAGTATPAGAGAGTTAETEPTTAPISSPLLVAFGIIAGVYLLYTIGWVVSISRSAITLDQPLSQGMFQLEQYLAIGGPALWFAGVFLLTRKSKPTTRLLWWLLGLAVFVPWPFVLGA